MKRVVLAVAVVFAVTCYTQAQSTGDIRVFGGFTYGSGVEDSGINIGGEFLFTDRIAADLSYSHYFVGSNTGYAVINVDGRYYIPTKLDFQWYGMLGLTFNTVRVNTPGFVGTPTERRNVYTGLNFGGGFVFPLTDELGFHGQAKINTAFDAQLELQLGISYGLN